MKKLFKILILMVCFSANSQNQYPDCVNYPFCINYGPVGIMEFDENPPGFRGLCVGPNKNRITVNRSFADRVEITIYGKYNLNIAQADGQLMVADLPYSILNPNGTFREIYNKISIVNYQGNFDGDDKMGFKANGQAKNFPMSNKPLSAVITNNCAQGISSQTYCYSGGSQFLTSYNFSPAAASTFNSTTLNLDAGANNEFNRTATDTNFQLFYEDSHRGKFTWNACNPDNCSTTQINPTYTNYGYISCKIIFYKACTLLAPQVLLTSSITSTTAIARWNPVANAQGYEVNIAEVGANYPTFPAFVFGQGASNNGFSNLVACKNYKWRIRTVCQGGTKGGWSDDQPFTTGSEPTILVTNFLDIFSTITPLNYCKNTCGVSTGSLKPQYTSITMPKNSILNIANAVTINDPSYFLDGYIYVNTVSGKKFYVRSSSINGSQITDNALLPNFKIIPVLKNNAGLTCEIGEIKIDWKDCEKCLTYKGNNTVAVGNNPNNEHYCFVNNINTYDALQIKQNGNCINGQTEVFVKTSQGGNSVKIGNIAPGLNFEDFVPSCSANNNDFTDKKINRYFHLYKWLSVRGNSDTSSFEFLVLPKIPVSNTTMSTGGVVYESRINKANFVPLGGTVNASNQNTFDIYVKEPNASQSYLAHRETYTGSNAYNLAVLPGNLYTRSGSTFILNGGSKKQASTPGFANKLGSGWNDDLTDLMNGPGQVQYTCRLYITDVNNQAGTTQGTYRMRACVPGNACSNWTNDTFQLRIAGEVGFDGKKISGKAGAGGDGGNLSVWVPKLWSPCTSTIIDSDFIANIIPITSLPCSGTANKIATNTKESKEINEKTSILTSKIFIAPNPVQNELILELQTPQSGKATYVVSDASGNSIAKGEIVCEGGVCRSVINTEGFKQGFYILQVTINGEVLTSKFIKR